MSLDFASYGSDVGELAAAVAGVFDKIFTISPEFSFSLAVLNWLISLCLTSVSVPLFLSIKFYLAS